jgi:divalent metal cation (Fe/Co/Zn/Cd) transporter
MRMLRVENKTKNRVSGLEAFALSPRRSQFACKSGSDRTRKTALSTVFLEVCWACVSLVMPILSCAKTRVSNALGSAAMKTEARLTDFCVYLSTILLAGLLLNAVLGWWRADPHAALINSDGCGASGNR